MIQGSLSAMAYLMLLLQDIKAMVSKAEGVEGEE